ncbi:MAG: TIR domain-containing protein [Methylobacter sp.]
MSDPLVNRFQQYFRHPDDDHDVLAVGDRAVACANVRRALDMLGIEFPRGTADELVYDETLRDAVRTFQSKYRHRVTDGFTGPGTRERLVSELSHQFSPSIFARLRRPETWSRRSVFISYSSVDRERVNKIDQWLRDKGLRVVRDCQFFVAGTTIQENIVRALAHSDKILAILSNSSRDRDWPRFERELAQQVETKLGTPVLIYLCLDDAALPAHDSTRLAIHSKGKTLKQVGEEILHAVAGVPIPQWQYAYDENEPI